MCGGFGWGGIGKKVRDTDSISAFNLEEVEVEVELGYYII